MLKSLIPAVFAGLLTAGASSAAVLDFIDFSNNNEQGVASGTSITSAAFGGETVTFSANSTYFPYFDHGSAGLGVCKVVGSPGATSNNGTGNQCNTPSSGSSDDNVTIGEAVTVSWSGVRTLSDMFFTGEYHGGTNPSNIEYLHLELTAADAAANGNSGAPRANKTLLFAINGGLFERYTFAGLTAASFNGVTSATFAFDNAGFDGLISNANGLSRDADQFYLAAATISAVPLPAGLPLLLAGLGGFGFLRNRRKAA